MHGSGSQAARWCVVGWVCLLLGLIGCGDDPPTSMPMPMPVMDSGVCDNPTHFVSWTCGVEDCHEPGNPAGVVDLASPGAAERLLNRSPKDCAGQLLVDANDPSQSFLLNKLTRDPICGDPMPLNRPALSANDVACVRAFVDQLVRDATDGGAP